MQVANARQGQIHGPGCRVRPGQTRRLRGEPHGYKQSIESSTRRPGQPGILATRHYRVSTAISLRRAPLLHLFCFLQLPMRETPPQCHERNKDDRGIRTRALSRPFIPLTVSGYLALSFDHLFSLLLPLLGSTFKPRPTPPRYLEKDTRGRRSKWDEDGRADIRYLRRLGVLLTPDFILVAPSRFGSATLRRVPAGRTARGTRRRTRTRRLSYVREPLPPPVLPGRASVPLASVL